MNLLFVCGGTAGHINPALAVASEFKKRFPKCKILFVGAGKELEKKLIPAAGFHLVNIKMSGLRRSVSPNNLLYNLSTVKNLTTAGIKAGKVIKRFSPDAVIGTGGYICYPVLKKAAQMGIPTVIHGSDAVPGLTTKMLSTTVDKILVSFPGLESQYKKPERVEFTGTPVRAKFTDILSKTDEADKKAKPLVISFWGSLGAERMNEAMAEFIKANIQDGRFEHIHATGKGGVERVKSNLKKPGMKENLPSEIKVVDYIEDMPSLMNRADLVLCRAGASTIAELTILGKPAVLVPSPYVTNNHQEANARQLEKAGGAVVILEKDCYYNKLYDVASELLNDREKLKRMSDAQKTLAITNAAEKIADIVMELIAKGKR